MRRQNHEDVSMAPSGREQVSVCDSVCGSLVISVRPSVRPSCVQTFKIALTVFDCARGRCPAYFSDICVPVHSVAGRSRLRSATVIWMSHVYRHSATVLVAFAFQGPPSGTHSHKTYEAVTFPGNSSSVDLRRSCLSVLMCIWRVWEFFIEDALYKFIFWFDLIDAKWSDLGLLQTIGTR